MESKLDGEVLVRRIIKRRLYKCVYSGKHKEGHCASCGIDVSVLSRDLILPI